MQKRKAARQVMWTTRRMVIEPRVVLPLVSFTLQRRLRPQSATPHRQAHDAIDTKWGFPELMVLFNGDEIIIFFVYINVNINFQ